MKRAETFEEWIEHSKQLVADLGEGFTKPDDDWVPVAFLQGSKQMYIAGLMVDKDQYKAVLRRLGKELEPQYATVVLSAWSMVMDGGYLPEGGISKHPDRTELLMLDVSDGRQNQRLLAKIQRTSDAPPTLGEWEEMTGSQGQLVGVALAAFGVTVRNYTNDEVN